MGSNHLISIEEAAELLLVSSRTITNLIQRGLLHPHYPAGQKLNAPFAFWSEEVEALGDVLERGNSLPEVAASAAQAFATSRSLLRRVAVLEQMNGVGVPALNFDEDSVIELWLSVQEDKRRTITHPDEVLKWAHVFMAISEEYFELIEKTLGKSEPWEPFLELAKKLTHDTPLELFDIEPMTRIAYGWLDTGRRNLRHAAFFHIRSRYGMRRARERFPDSASDVHAEVLAYATLDY